MIDYLKAPWTEDQIKCINDYQESGVFHPYTCDFCRNVLVAVEDGWVCVCGKHKQDWCLSWMAEFEKNSASNQFSMNLNKLLNK